MKVPIAKKTRLIPASQVEITLGLEEHVEDMSTEELEEIEHVIQAELLRRVKARKFYPELLNEVVASALAMKGTSGYEAIRKIIFDLEGDGAIAALIHKLDNNNFQRILILLREFRISGVKQPFNKLHQDAKNAISG